MAIDGAGCAPEHGRSDDRRSDATNASGGVVRRHAPCIGPGVGGKCAPASLRAIASCRMRSIVRGRSSSKCGDSLPIRIPATSNLRARIDVESAKRRYIPLQADARLPSE